MGKSEYGNPFSFRGEKRRRTSRNKLKTIIALNVLGSLCVGNKVPVAEGVEWVVGIKYNISTIRHFLVQGERASVKGK